jgi:hypothetical protein
MKQFLFLLLLFSAIYSQENSGIQFNGFVEIENKTYPKKKNPTPVDDGRNQVIFLLKSKASPVENIKLFSSVEVRYDEVNPLRNRVYLKEAYIDYERETFDFRIGKQVYAWGKADGINPTNNLNPVDFSDLIDTDDEEIGMVSLRGRYYFGKWTFEGIVMPIFEASIIPANNSRWSIFNLTLPVETQKPANEFKNFQLGGKISSSFAGWDFSGSYYKGFEKFPSGFIKLDANFKPSTLVFKYRELQVVGADFATSFDKLGIRGETGYFIPANFKLKPGEIEVDTKNPQRDGKNYFQYVLGADYNFNDLVGEQDLYILGQWIQEFNVSKGASFKESDLRHLFQRAVMLKADWSFTDYTKFSFQGIYRLKSEDIFTQTMLSSNLADGLNLEVGADLFYGKKGSFFEGFKDNQRAFARLKYSF